MVLLLPWLLLTFPHEVGLDGLILIVKVTHVYDQIFLYVHKHERGHCGRVKVVLRYSRDASKVVSTIDVHATGATDAFPATPSERQRGINLIFDKNKYVEKHRPTLVQIHVVRQKVSLIIWVSWIRPIHVYPLHLGLSHLIQFLAELVNIRGLYLHAFLKVLDDLGVEPS